MTSRPSRMARLAAATAASGRPLGSLRNDQEWRVRLDSAIVEACAVAEADGVSLRPASQWAIIDEMADETTTSAARDVAAGNPELRFACKRRVVDQADPAADPRVHARAAQRAGACREGGAQVQVRTAGRERGKVDFDARRVLVEAIERRV